ncbi:LamG-like jellyroll fold domain-containing protein [Microbulbifer sp. SSSA008]|uniref:LamG-like jellyroll fold domain-containing protein n=1 Tax=Microbulbifer sp. SSSA008 TaxID=3243380 RepID=UPI00403A0676
MLNRWRMRRSPRLLIAIIVLLSALLGMSAYSIPLFLTDTDLDGLSDEWESLNNHNPNVADSHLDMDGSRSVSLGNFYQEVSDGNADNQILEGQFSLDLSYNSGYVSTNYYPTGDTGHTLMYWVKFSELDQSQTIGTHDGNNHRLYVGINANNNLFAGVGDSYSSTVPSGIVIGEWVHFAVTGDGAQAKVYINGEEKAVFDYQFNGQSQTNLWLGVRSGHTGDFTGINGVIDDVQIWKSPLSPEHIKYYSNYKPPVNEPELIAHYDFNRFQNNTVFAENTSEIESILIEGGNIGYADNAPRSELPVPSPETKHFRAADGNYLKTNFFPAEHSEITLMYWVKYSAIDKDQRLGSHDGSDHRMYLGVNKTGDIFAGLGSGYTNSVPSGIVPDEWAHVAMTGDGAQAIVYVNGRQIAEFSYSFVGTSSTPLFIGAMPYKNTEVQGISTGLFDEVQIWNKQLTPIEISEYATHAPNDNEDYLAFYAPFSNAYQTGSQEVVTGGYSIIEVEQATYEFDSDLIAFPDSDGDGLENILDRSICGSSELSDTDLDGLNDFIEYQKGTSPCISDTDNDGLSDSWEVQNGTNPLVDDALEDIDNDGEINLFEAIRFAELSGHQQGKVSLTQAALELTSSLPQANYLVREPINVGKGKTLTIEPGVILEFEEEVRFDVYGGLDVKGTEEHPVTFTALSTSKRWKGIWTSHDADMVSIFHSIISHADVGVNLNGSANIMNNRIHATRIGIYMDNSNSVSPAPTPMIINNDITENDWGLSIYGKASSPALQPRPVINYNRIFNNNNKSITTNDFGSEAETSQIVVDATKNWFGTTDAKTILDSIYDHRSREGSPWIDISNPLNEQGETLPTLTIFEPINSEYMVPAGDHFLFKDLVVNDTGKLIFEPGATLNIKGSTTDISIYGEVDIRGTEAQRVTLTSYDDSRWGDFIVRNSAKAASINYALIEQADQGVTMFITGSITNSILRKNRLGIYISNSASISPAPAPLIINNDITENDWGLSIYGKASSPALQPRPVINYNRIFNNNNKSITTNDFGSEAETSQIVVDATKNWFGTTDAKTILDSIYDHRSREGSPWIDISNPLNEQGETLPTLTIFEPINSEYVVPAGDHFLFKDLVVNDTGKLIFEPGATLNIKGSTTDISIYGEVDIRGTEAQRVTLTSYDDSKWGDFIVRNSAKAASINYALIEQADQGVTMFITGSITNSILRKNRLGIYISNSASISPAPAPLIINNDITENDWGLVVNGKASSPALHPRPVINHNRIFNNINKNLYTNKYGTEEEANQITIDATQNWWGFEQPIEILSKIDDHESIPEAPWVDYSNWIISDGSEPVSTTILRGRVQRDLFLTPGDHYLIQETVVGSDARLELLPGARVFADPGTKLIVEGDLIVNGSGAQPVLFISEAQYPAAGDWKGIVVASGGSVNIDNAYIQHAETALSAISPSAFSVTNSIITDFSESGISLKEFASGTIANSLIQNANYAGTGIAMDTASPAVTDNIVTGLHYGAYVTGASSPSFIGNAFINNTYGIYLNGSGNDAINPTPTITGNDLYGNTNGSLYLNNYGSSSALLVNATGNWWGSATPEWGVDIIAVDSPETALDYSNALPVESRTIAANLSGSYEYFSPNSDGSQDTLTITAALSSSSNWSLQVSNESGAVVNTFTGTGSNININWDGTDTSSTVLNDGRYYLFLKINDTENTSYRAGAIWVELDNTAPIAEMSNVNDGDTLSSGTTKLEIQGSATDSLFVSYTLDYQLNGDNDNWVNLGSSTSAVSESTLAKWVVNSTDGTVEAPAIGDYQIRLVANDRAGNVTTIIRTVILDLISIANVGRNQTTVNPVAGESLVIDFDLSAGATVTLDIKDEQTEVLVRSVVETFENAGSYSLSWDGRDGEGNYVQEEAYTYDLTAVSGSAEGVYVIEDEDNTTTILAGTMDTTMNAVQNDFMKTKVTPTANIRLTMEVTPDGSTPRVVYDDVPMAAGSHYLAWDGRTADGVLTRGSFYAFIPSHEILPTNVVIIDGINPSISGTLDAPNIEVKSDPYLMYHSYDQISKVAYLLDQDSYVTFKLLPPDIGDPTDAGAITLIDNQLQAANDSDGAVATHEVEWTGYEESDGNAIMVSDEGVYSFWIEATSATTGASTTYYGALQLYQ